MKPVTLIARLGSAGGFKFLPRSQKHSEKTTYIYERQNWGLEKWGGWLVLKPKADTEPACPPAAGQVFGHGAWPRQERDQYESRKAQSGFTCLWCCSLRKCCLSRVQQGPVWSLPKEKEGERQRRLYPCCSTVTRSLGRSSCGVERRSSPNLSLLNCSGGLRFQEVRVKKN